MASGYRGSRRGQTPLASIAMTDESLEDFKNSFSYGTRTDLSFKFLKKLSAADAGEFLRQLLEEVGASLDHGDITRLHDLVYEWQVRGYMPARDAPTQWSYEDGPLTNLGKPLADCTVGLLTSSPCHSRARFCSTLLRSSSQDSRCVMSSTARVGSWRCIQASARSASTRSRSRCDSGSRLIGSRSASAASASPLYR